MSNELSGTPPIIETENPELLGFEVETVVYSQEEYEAIKQVLVQLGVDFRQSIPPNYNGFKFYLKESYPQISFDELGTVMMNARNIARTSPEFSQRLMNENSVAIQRLIQARVQLNENRKALQGVFHKRIAQLV
jgi:hypothetical protein